jgi:hypothetical protein
MLCTNRGNILSRKLINILCFLGRRERGWGGLGNRIYEDVIDSVGFLDKDIEQKYPLKDYHGIFYGEVLAISGLPSFILR